METVYVDQPPLLTFGFPDNVEASFGSLQFGAEPPQSKYKSSGLDFRICGTLPSDDGTVVYGCKRHKKEIQVWRATTTDGVEFTGAAQLFDVPETTSQWIAGDIAAKDGDLYLLQAQMGSPPTKGHPFHIFSGPLDGGEWHKLNDAQLYRGQDAFSMVWNDELKLFVNYQTSYQPWSKQFADNMPNVRRVLHIRTSPDGLHWTPGESFGVDGPYLPQEQFIVPDAKDSPDSEFYHFSPIKLEEFWAGIMVIYAAQPSLLPRCGGFPHGPFLGYEWWISQDGLNWTRPFRENSALSHTRHPFAYFLTQPIMVDNELRWATGDEVYTMDRRRMFYAYCHANAEVTTRPLALSGQPIVLDISFESIRKNADPFIRQGYLMAELLDGDDKVIPGFERDRCVFHPDDRTRITLQWDDVPLPINSNDPVRLRIYFRDVRLYSATY